MRAIAAMMRGALFALVSAAVLACDAPAPPPSASEPLPAVRVADLPGPYALPYGPDPFRPAEARLVGAELLAPDALAGSARCGVCHPVIYRQWQASLHRASAEDVFYRFAVDRTAESYGPPPTRLCVACHEPGALLAGRVDRASSPTPATRREGISCLSCHLVVATHASESMHEVANGSYDVEPPNDAVLFPPVGAEPSALARHRDALRRPFLSENRFCDACHRFFLPTQLVGTPPGRLRLQSEETRGTPYGDPADPGYRSCVDCHMPRLAGDDPAAKQGLVHDHRALGANVLVPELAGDREHAEATHAFRRAGAVDLAVGALRRGSDGALELPVTLHNGLNGHDFPTGATDISEAWLEGTLTDARGQVAWRSPGLDGQRFLDPDAPSLNSVVRLAGGNLDDLHDLVSQVELASHPRVRPGGTRELAFRVTLPAEAQPPLTARVVLRARHGNERWNRWAFNFQDVEVPVTDLAEVEQALDALPPPGPPAPAPPTPPPAPEGMAWIPGGTYRLGADPRTDPDATLDEFPPHSVELKPFFLDRRPVTYAEYARAVAAGWAPAPRPMAEAPLARHSWRGPQPPEGLDDHPVVLLTQDEARAYCRALGKRLPTEAEWEAAARGKEGRRFAWGDAVDPARCNTIESGRGLTVPAGSQPANATPEGVRDLGCNVAEWVDDALAAYPRTRHLDNRDDWIDRPSEESGIAVARGATYEMAAWRSRGSTRIRAVPEHRRLVGVRCALDASEARP